MPKYCEPRKFATEEQRSLDEGSEKQNDWRSLLVELSPAVRAFGRNDTAITSTPTADTRRS